MINKYLNDCEWLFVLTLHDICNKTPPRDLATWCGAYQILIRAGECTDSLDLVGNAASGCYLKNDITRVSFSFDVSRSLKSLF
jgi:hypothetical protein